MGLLDWIMLSGAGAMITEIMLVEQARYPWKLFALLSDVGMIDEVLADNDMCPRTMDTLDTRELASPRIRQDLHCFRQRA